MNPTFNLRLNRIIKSPIATVIGLLGLFMILTGIVIALCQKTNRKRQKPKLLWGTAPIISLTYMSQAMKKIGYESEVIVTSSSSIYDDKQFDRLIRVHYSFYLGRVVAAIVSRFRAYYFFTRALIRFDIFHYYFDAGILSETFLKKIELKIIKFTGKKLILMPYGADSFVNDCLPNLYWRHGLLVNYPHYANAAKQIQRNIRKRSGLADCIIACLVHLVNLPRWDILPAVYYPINLESLEPLYPNSTGKIRIAHAPNHRGIKGTEFLIHAVEQLKKEGYDIQLDVIEKRPNHEALYIISKADIFVDQLIMGYALAAIEALSLGKVVISGIHFTPEYNLFRDYSYLDECPIIPASITTIYQVLKKLITERHTWHTIGLSSRRYVEKRHSFKACTEMFTAIYDKIWYGKNIDLINFYHPLTSKNVQDNLLRDVAEISG